MLVELDLTEVHALTREATRSLDRVPQVMKATLDRAADQEARDHAYQNRTGFLEASTYASAVEESGDEAVVELAARMDYASYVNNRGLMRIDERAAEAATELEYAFEGEAVRLGSL
jgi:hypothetical protein